MTHLKVVLLAIITMICPALKAQKLPNIQKAAIAAPPDIKIDGRANEWNNHFEAYNRSTEVFYSVANDKNYLFVIVQSKDPVIVKKILAGGITFTVNLTGKKEEKSVAITYPRVRTEAKHQLGTLISEMPLAGNVAAKPRADSLVKLTNSILNASIKEIKMTGISSLPDTLFSVYNNTGIKAAIHFDAASALTYELAIPIKYLTFLTNDTQPFKYQILLNGLLAAESVRVRDPGPRGVVSVASIPMSMSGSSISQTINYPTDLWGDYILVK